MKFYLLLAAVALFIAWLTVPPLFLSPLKGVAPAAEAVNLPPPEQSLDRLSRAIRIPTVSAEEEAKVDTAPFDDFHRFLEQNFPLIHQKMEKQVLAGHTLVYKWPGRNPALKPVLLMNHMDVVPVLNPELWQQPPFGGVIADGYIWGRGSLDDKSGLMAQMEAAEILTAQGYAPERSIYFLFGHDEERGGKSGGAATAARWFADQGIRFEFVLDEGMVIADGLLPGVEIPVAMIGIAEKGYMDLKLTARSEGGHSSMPEPGSSIERLSRALDKLYDHPLPQQMMYIEMLGKNLKAHMPYGMKVAFHNYGLLKPLLKKGLGNNSTLSPFMRTTTAPTILRAGEKSNVIPAEASAVVNFRIIPGESSDDVVRMVADIIDDPHIRLEKLTASEPSPVSDPDSASFQLIRQTILETAGDEDIATTPQLVTAATDSRFLRDVTDNTYRFQYVHVTPALRPAYHGQDERLRTDDYAKMIEFYVRLMKNTDGM
ncbi:M20/M25/M40 family metallo-hydrolase [Emcibacter nanhaiensis]|uniref:M20/M25/M40 family metallo-hydrolase n=1 Tax=Emcibacter nanhaiensis TaxID=1505037 RepID=A0A501PCG3_9PROT|nr:M20/M25/M40 family metallo-hydrolase [Emcibacter nanhaiensis]TPD57697.1 M20/M25/M40 family metallo-hydrolase [Emcibacter nanhaiensis]